MTNNKIITYVGIISISCLILFCYADVLKRMINKDI